MNYHKQTKNACMAYSLLQLGRVSKKAVKEYERILEANDYSPHFTVVGKWLDKYAPEVKEAWQSSMPLVKPAKRVPKRGKGVAIIMGETPHFRCWHALSFKDGKVLDSDADVGHTETLADVKARWKASGYDEVKFIALFRVKDQNERKLP